MRVFVTVALLLGLSGLAQAGNSKPGALSRCTQLLPEGKDYSVKIDATARRDGTKTTVKNTIAVEGTTTVVLPKDAEPPAASKEDAEAFGREIQAFQKCLSENL